MPGEISQSHQPHISKAEVDTETKRRVSLKEAAKISLAIYYEILAREECSRELEAKEQRSEDDVNAR